MKSEPEKTKLVSDLEVDVWTNIHPLEGFGT